MVYSNLKNISLNKGRFFFGSKLSVWSKKSDSGCFSLRSKMQPCELLYYKLTLRSFAKWPS
ncbi:Uncharacterised protein [uncultured archaeon]|nr:Uncharacterised protein [uncultured archaeon]